MVNKLDKSSSEDFSDEEFDERVNSVSPLKGAKSFV